LAFKLANNLSNATFKELLKLIKIARMASNEEIISAAEYVRKYDIDKKYDLKKEFVCMSDKCDHVLSTNKDNKPTKKQKCGHDFDPSKGSCFTITLSPIEKKFGFAWKMGPLAFLQNHTTALLEEIFKLAIVTERKWLHGQVQLKTINGGLPQN